MSPRRLDIAVVLRRLSLMTETLEQLKLLAFADVDQFTANPLDRAAAERLLQVLVDLAIDINSHLAVAMGSSAPETGRDSFLALGSLGVIDPALAELLAPAAGMRNVLVHRYFDIRLNELVRGVEMALQQFPSYVRAVAVRLETWEPPRA